MLSERERVQKELERRKQEEQERRQMEALAQSKLRQLGVCVQGYNWIKQGGGYTCAGGSHWVNDSQLGPWCEDKNHEDMDTDITPNAIDRPKLNSWHVTMQPVSQF